MATWFSLWVRNIYEPNRWWEEGKKGAQQYCEKEEEKITGPRPNGRYPDTNFETMILPEGETPYTVTNKS